MEVEERWGRLCVWGVILVIRRLDWKAESWCGGKPVRRMVKDKEDFGFETEQ